MQHSAVSVLLEHLDCGVLFLDTNYNILIVNGYLSFLFGTGTEPVQSGEALTLLNNLLASGINPLPRAEEIMHIQKYRIGEDYELNDGRTIEINYIPVLENSVLFGHLWLLREATYRKYIENKLVQEKLSNEKYIRMHGNYLKAAAGGINSSLNSILGLSLLLRQMEVENPIREYTEAIKSTAEGAAALSKSLSPDLFVKVNDGRIKQKYYLHSTVEKLCGVFSAILAAEGRLLNFVAEGFNEQTIVLTDAERLNGAISILLAQMLEAPGGGDIDFLVMLNGTHLSIKVSTPVSEVSPESVQGFEENTTLEEVIRLADLLGGTLTNTTEENVRTMVLSLEVEKAIQSKAVKEFAREDIVIDQLKDVRVLALASHEDSRLLLQGLLSAWGTDFILSFPEEIQYLPRPFLPQVLIFDFDLTDNPAVSLAETFGSVPAVFIVVSEDEKRNFIPDKGREHRVLSKPFFPQELCSAVAELAKPERRHAEPTVIQAVTEAEQNDLQVYDLSRLKQTAVGNPQVVKTIINECIEVVPGLLVELEQAADEMNTRKVHFLSQQLSTYFGYLGMSEAVSLVKQLERFSYSPKDTGERMTLINNMKKLFRFVQPRLTAELTKL